jgi:peroxiredoxin/RimJ/RimL family protein N-acetyltransferase
LRGLDRHGDDWGVSDYTALPEGLPVPVDDGGAEGLVGSPLPDLPLPSTRDGEVSLAEAGAGLLVAYVYPMTGTPGTALPEGWDDIPGARGCTPQSCAYRDARAEFRSLGADLLGISAQTPAEQAEFAAREHIPYPLLSDDGLRLAEALGLPTFAVEGRGLYRRLTFVAAAGRIVKVFYPVFPPDRDAAEVLAWLRPRAADPIRSPSPRLEDGVVALRPWTEADFPLIDEAAGDPEIVRRNGLPQPFDARAWFERTDPEQRRGEGIRLLIVDPGSDRLLGAISLSRIDRDRLAAELGYWVTADARGRGVGGRAIGLLSAWAFAELGLGSIVADTDADNLASRGLLEKAGFRPAADGGATVRYRLEPEREG